VSSRDDFLLSGQKKHSVRKKHSPFSCQAKISPGIAGSCRLELQARFLQRVPGGFMQQRTISKSVSCVGVGLHSGRKAAFALRPAAEDAGLVFHVATDGGKRTIVPSPDAVLATGLATTLGAEGAAVSTVEHLLAALRGLGVDNLHIDVEGGEIPILDGSASPFADLLAEAGIRTQAKARKVLRVKKTVEFCEDGKSIRAEPYAGFFIDCAIDFPHPCIGRQRIRLDLTPRNFARVAGARTFGFLRDVEALKERGLALGGSLDNAVVLDEQSVVNRDGLRYDDEFVRHKLLDFIGDMAVLPLPLQGRFTVCCSGHDLNNRFLRHIARPRAGFLERVTLGDGHERPASLPLPRPADGLPVRAFAG
jgi:UDP-3-O-[3-hydroxymyristoyl] N-acetylglucosamine deacetylase